jgi:hypothetical protein
MVVLFWKITVKPKLRSGKPSLGMRMSKFRASSTLGISTIKGLSEDLLNS